MIRFTDYSNLAPVFSIYRTIEDDFLREPDPRFDVHAMIYSENAPALENALHKAFDSKRVNLINYRKEYFNVSLEEIETHVKQNHEAEIEFTRLAEAQEYRETVAKLKQLNEQFAEEAKEPEFPDELF